MVSKPDIVSLMWTIGLMNEQADNAEKSLVDFSRDESRKDALLQCMWAVHQITSTLQALGMKKAELLTLEMERSLNYLYKGKLPDERAKLVMGGLMQAIKILPAYLAHTQTVRRDTGQGLEQFINDLRRWAGQRPRPPALFFNLTFEPTCGITTGASPAADQEIADPFRPLALSQLVHVAVRLGHHVVGVALQVGFADRVAGQAGDALVVAVQLSQVLGKDVLGAGEQRDRIVAATAVACRLGSVLLRHDALHLLKQGVHGRIAVGAGLPLGENLGVAVAGAAAVGARQ